MIRKSEFVGKTQFLCDRVIFLKFFVGQIILFKFVPKKHVYACAWIVPIEHSYGQKVIIKTFLTRFVSK